tara:strand:+ start:271 stop:681 length:411 start_codon:yes stop_codon:yes gene_type:complete
MKSVTNTLEVLKMKKKLHWSKYHKNYKDYILEVLDCEDALIGKNLSRKEKIEYLSNRFFSEYKFQIERVGIQKAMSEWLSGLAINIPYTYYDVIKLAQDMGSVNENLTEKQEEKICEGYWDFMAMMTLNLINEEVK